MLDFSGDFLYFSFKCSKKYLERSTYTMEYRGYTYKVDILKNENKVHIVCTKNDSEVMFYQIVDYYKNQWYEITCSLSNLPVINTHDVHTHSDMSECSESIIDGYQCLKRLSPSYSKKIYKYFLKNKMVSKPAWDSFMKYYDWKCLACNHSWVGNPDTGYVRPYKEDETQYNGNKPIDRSKKFVFRNIAYIPCDENEYNQITWLNMSQYKRYQIDRTYRKWPTFKELWELPNVKPDWNKTNEQQGHMWRDKNDPYHLIRDEDFVKVEHPRKFEKVISLGYHSTNPKDSVECPICKMLNKVLCRSGYSPLNPLQKLREKFSNAWSDFISRIKVKISDYKYDRDH